MADQTFGFMDGSQYNSSGQQLSGATGGAPVIPPTIPLNQPAPSATTPVTVNPTTQVPSTALATPKTGLDIASLLQQNVSKQDSLIQSITGYMTPTEQEIADQKNLNDAINKQQNFDVSYEGGLQKIAKQPIALEFQQGQQAALTRDAAFTRYSLARQVDAYTRVLQSDQTSRSQKLDAAKFLYDANRNSLSDTITLMKATAPENIGNVVDPQTGEMTVIMKNPITGEVSRNNLGVVQTPQKQIDNIKYAQDAGVSQPFYTKTNGANQVVVNATNGREYSTVEQAAADGVDVKNWSNVEHNVKSLQNQQYGLQREEFDYKKTQDALNNRINLSEEARKQAQFNIDNGITGPTGSSIAAVYPDGSTGPGSGNLKGQCAVFTEAISDLGTPGNKLGMDLKAKQKTVNDYGVSADQWRNEGANVGDAIIFNIGKYGHTATVNSVNADGTVTLSESNYGNDGKVSNTRTIPITDKSIYGVIRGTLKSNVITNTNKSTPIKLTPSQQQAFQVAGLDKQTINAIMSDIGQHGIDSVLSGDSGLSDAQKQIIQNELQPKASKTTNDFRLDDGWVANSFPRDVIYSAGQQSLGLIGRAFSSESDVYKKGIEVLIKKAQQLKDGGSTSEEIIKKIYGN